MDLIRRAASHLHRPAVVHEGVTYTYETLLTASEDLSRRISSHFTRVPGQQPPRIGLHASPGIEYVLGTWAIWRNGGIAVPLAVSHPPAELDYVFQDAGLTLALTGEDAEARVGSVASSNKAHTEVISRPFSKSAPAGTAATSSCDSAISATSCDADLKTVSGAGALIIYTSGTTGKPKGVLHTHRSLTAQYQTLCRAWEWEQADRILHTLPLHHVHGIVNAAYCPLAVGACIDFMPKFSPSAVWSHLMEGETSVFMGVPTMYSMLLSAYDKMTPSEQARSRAAAAQLRLTVSGSSACPVPIMRRWKDLSGQTLLERYGMTEVGMALSNPYRGGERRPGTVGQPLPGVVVAVADDGELLVKGPLLFDRYWGRPQATADAFDAAGFFKTGDTVAVDLKGTPSATTMSDCNATSGSGSGMSSNGSSNGGGSGSGSAYYTILGRTSVDIIKTGGYKVSALDIEGVLLEHQGVAEVAVLGMADEVYGQVVTAVVAAKEGSEGGPDALPGMLRAHCARRLAPYQAPRHYHLVASIPRNAMGKVNKKELAQSLLNKTLS